MRLIKDGYIAGRSNHNHGHTIDLGLARAGSCEPVDMGTAWDTLDERSHTRNATGEVLANRTKLRAAMLAAGFADYPREWWHFNYKMRGTRPRDVAYALREP
jgi:D-alanyl-D-alanine dipeptidase